ncbi:Signal recognition particle receptor FtsY [uncultured delta proteobacterium]|uniref:Signal recognition particle receptor FtsY n=1 Tax=uncultured delta proteobacterium TaxID=34034 RepID=A0A212JUL5_9DELT|nr:Signal recognition particle receptor FtsY [uncultured delta proteobacterium]
MGFFSSIKKLWGPGGGDAAPGPDVTAAPAAAPASPLAPEDTGEWKESLSLALREAEPRLSVWLALVLKGVSEAGPLLWERLGFLFDALEIPAGEKEAFIASFAAWLDDMGYAHVDEFRSELQFRLALALDLEDEEDEKSRLLLKLSDSLAKTREQLGRGLDTLFASHATISGALWEELEELLIIADVGVASSQELVSRLKKRAYREKITDPSALRGLLFKELAGVFTPRKRIQAVTLPEVVMVIGVNGVGKTTTIAKMAYRARMQGKTVLVAAADTFRAAAVEQLEVWSKRVGASFYAKGANADPAAVAYEAVEKALEQGVDLLLVDTAGRLHTKANLMEELTKIRRVLGKKHPGAPHRSILVIDATTGQNALSQVKLFQEAAGIDEIILTKLDGTAKGGIVAAVAMQFAIPITYVGLGEKMEDLRPFDGEQFARALIGADHAGGADGAA